MPVESSRRLQTRLWSHGRESLNFCPNTNRCPENRKHATIVFMLVAVFAMRVLELAFFVGLVGSSVVVVISFIEDGKELFGKDEE